MLRVQFLARPPQTFHETNIRPPTAFLSSRPDAPDDGPEEHGLLATLDEERVPLLLENVILPGPPGLPQLFGAGFQSAAQLREKLVACRRVVAEEYTRTYFDRMTESEIVKTRAEFARASFFEDVCAASAFFVPQGFYDLVLSRGPGTPPREPVVLFDDWRGFSTAACREMTRAVVNGELRNLLLLDARVCVTYHVRTDDAEALTKCLTDELGTETFADD